MQNQDGTNAKQLIVEKVRQSTNILVAVSADPSVDALSAALALSLTLNKMGKHSTAVFSGQMPPAMEFLSPDKTFEAGVDSLRDFIISLDKEKADRLRYKVEDDVVRIFITPYRTNITEQDLEFSQGDFNVDLIIALGVEKSADLDKALTAHGRILHDATVVTINVDNQQANLGTIDWHDPNASSLCEMLVSMSEAFQQPGLLDTQISTALLTGIVAATERFSNQRTTPRVMTMSAQLMAGGANQQLIATNLAKAREIPQSGAPLRVNAAQSLPDSVVKKADGELDITHESAKIGETPKTQDKKEPAPTEQVESQGQSGRGRRNRGRRQAQSAEDQLSAALPGAAAANNSFDDLKQAIKQETKGGEALPKEESSTAPLSQGPEIEKPHPAPGSQSVNDMDGEEPSHTEVVDNQPSWRGKRLEPPTLGSPLNATTEQAMEDEKRAEEEDRNKTLLDHQEKAKEEPHKKAGLKVIEPPKHDEPKDQAVVAEPPAPAPVPVEVPTPEPKPPEPAPAPPPLPPLPPLPPAPEPFIEPAPALAVEKEPPQPVQAPPLSPLPEPNTFEPAPSEPLAAAATAAAPDLDAARQAVNQALLEPAPPTGVPEPTIMSDQPVPPMNAALQQSAIEPPQGDQVNAPPMTAPPLPELPPLPPLPPLPGDMTAAPGSAPDAMSMPPQIPPAIPDLPPPPPLPQSELDQPAIPPPAAGDPGQFKIPGQ